MKRTYLEYMKAKDSFLGKWVLLSGAEQQLKRELLDRVRREAESAAPGDEPSWEVLDGPSVTAREVAGRCQTGALFGGARVVVIREADRIPSGNKGDDDEPAAKPDGAKKKDVQKELAAMVRALPEGVAVVLVTGESRDRRKPDVKTALRSAITKDGLAIDCPAMKGPEAVSWVTEQAKKLGKKIEPAAARKLVEQKVGTGLGELEAEMEKLALFVGDGAVITVGHVDVVTPRLLEEDVFRLLDAVARGEAGHAVAVVRGLLQEKRGAPGGILWQLAQSFRELWQVKLLMERGWRPGQEPDGESAALLPRDPRKNVLARLKGNRAWLLNRLAERAPTMTWARLTQAMQALRGCDLAMKGIKGKVTDDETTLELLVIQLSTGIEMPIWDSLHGERMLG